jgi:hypothetical protein
VSHKGRVQPKANEKLTDTSEEENSGAIDDAASLVPDEKTAANLGYIKHNLRVR